MEGDEPKEATAEVVESTATAVGGDQPPEATAAGNEIKVVITYKGGVGTVGIQKPDSDPVFYRIEGDLPEVIASIPRLVDQARATWETNPKYPKADLPAPPPPPPRPASARPQAAAPAKRGQPAFF